MTHMLRENTGIGIWMQKISGIVFIGFGVNLILNSR
jgi:threonine/homoserine/homoserine lactone efflux protein